MSSDPRETYKSAEQRLRAILFGDGTYEPGVVHGEEQRGKVSTELRRMREAFAEVARRETNLEEELLSAAKRTTTRERS